MATILIVDDENMIRDFLTEILSEAGYEILSASDGEEALDIIHKHPIALIITDIIMPDMEGLEFIRKVKSEGQQLKIIAMSGGGIVDAETYLGLALKFGANKIIKKPLRKNELLNSVREILR